jgi:dihydroorotate dehydrogenase
MNILRKGSDAFYDAIKPIIFRATKKDPEIAHSLFILYCNWLYKLNLDRLVLDNFSNHQSPYLISNAAGFNKNAEIPPRALKYLGFDRVVIGTVTGDEWVGNPRPRTQRFPKTHSLVNWMGLPGIGASGVAERLHSYEGQYEIPLTINLMATPGKKWGNILSDLAKTTLALRNIPNVDRFELNISCPNTHSQTGELDARREYKANLGKMAGIVRNLLLTNQSLDLKVSPDSSEQDIEDIIDAALAFGIRRITTTNTTTHHHPNFIPDSPGKGGASGNAVYDASLIVQKMFYERINQRNLDLELIACGGINTPEKRDERLKYGAKEIQIYTPLIFSGTRILRDLRK